MREEGLVWLEEGFGDCRTAALLLREGIYNAAAFYAHQAAEKALKALHVLARRDPPRTHNLLALYRGLRDAGLELSPGLEEGLAALTKYYATSRCPDAAGGPPSQLFTRREAEGAVAVARDVLELAAGLFRAHGAEPRGGC